MAFVKKTWRQRQSEYPNRRRLEPVPGYPKMYDSHREEGLVMEEGTPLDAANLNDLEQRIFDACNGSKRLVLVSFDESSGTMVIDTEDA